jgi:hypothetical protein
VDRKLFLSIIPIFIILFAIHFSNVEARQTTTHYPVLVVAYSEVCQKMITYHIKSSCEPLSNLIKYDTSNQKVSGKFIILNDTVIRTNPQLKNHWLYYQKQIVCVACNVPLDKPDLFSVIFIEPGDFTYTYKNDNATKNTYKSYKDRFTTPDCITTMIGSKTNFDYLLNDTIHYVLSGCKITAVNVNQTNTIKSIPFTFDNPFSSLHYKNQIQNIKKNGLPNCFIQKCDIKDPYKKSNWNKK